VTYLLDTNIIIYLTDAEERVTAFIRKHHRECAISMITYYEVLNYDFSEIEATKIENLLKQFTLLPLSMDIVNRALKNRRYRKIKMADNFILATAQHHHLDLVTNDRRDFKPFLDTINPFLNQHS